MEEVILEISDSSPFAYFVGVWWVSVTVHLVLGLVFWLTKAGRWSSLWDG